MGRKGPAVQKQEGKLSCCSPIEIVALEFTEADMAVLRDRYPPHRETGELRGQAKLR